MAAPDWSALESRVGGRLGVFAINAGTGRSLGWRASERFPMCSTFKGLLAGAVLARVDAGREQLDREIPLSEADLVAHAPVTSLYVRAGSIRVDTLCKAIVEVSDNPGANLLLKTLGGPAGFTAWLRTTGDNITRLDRYETELNSAIPDDPRDSTSPMAMVGSYRRLLLGPSLESASRQRLAGWMEGASTGLKRLRADLPAGWRAGDKTGSGANNTANDVAILWPPRGAPILVGCFSTQATAPEARDAVMAHIGRLAAETLA
ncbi:class A beta-lactamase [Phenylobacterium kunshanense]|uniref:Beta-lactamase n=2 Tax=Phenylobacterium kunshanense TaxID=1445034 RepID=A0A328BFB1_9CAUL|nr:class A beta-lactamase [Phenylobacterium kunshanense]